MTNDTKAAAERLRLLRVDFVVWLVLVVANAACMVLPLNSACLLNAVCFGYLLGMGWKDEATQ